LTKTRVYLFTCSKNDAIMSVQKHYCALGLELESGLGWELGLFEIGLGLELAEVKFRSNVFSSKCSNSRSSTSTSTVSRCFIRALYSYVWRHADLKKQFELYILKNAKLNRTLYLCSNQDWWSWINFNGFGSCSGARFSKLLSSDSGSGAGHLPILALIPVPFELNLLAPAPLRTKICYKSLIFVYRKSNSCKTKKIAF